MTEKNETTPFQPNPLRGVLKMVASQQSPDSALLEVFDYDGERLENFGTKLQKRRKAKTKDEQIIMSRKEKTFEELVAEHRYVCFFFIQGHGTYFSPHSVSLRERLATYYYDSMTTFVVHLDKNHNKNKYTENNDGNDDSLFYQGTGFAVLPPSPIMTTVFNVSQVPTAVIVDTTTGRPLSKDAGLAIEWNDAHYVINAWQRGGSGLSCSQQVLATLTLQSNCTIM